jgi:hypothetical protein
MAMNRLDEIEVDERTELPLKSVHTLAAVPIPGGNRPESTFPPPPGGTAEARYDLTLLPALRVICIRREGIAAPRMVPLEQVKCFELEDVDCGLVTPEQLWNGGGRPAAARQGASRRAGSPA